MAGYSNKPNVYVDFDFYQGDPDNAKATEVPQARDMLKPDLKRTFDESGLFLGAWSLTNSRSNQAITVFD
nr:hypothetical protein GCM10020185_75870 [Pseudomonas brassicacearum subsp. brassicacearum]